jgi:hypothetical protein
MAVVLRGGGRVTFLGFQMVGGVGHSSLSLSV